MFELVIAILITVLTLVQFGAWLALGLSRRIVAATPRYLLVLAGGTIFTIALVLLLVPALIIIKVISGWSGAVYLAVLVAVVLTVALGILWSPAAIAIGTVLDPIHPVRAGERYLRRIGVILFADLMLALGVLLVPFHQNLGMIPLFLLTGVAVVLAAMLWGGYLGPRFYRWVAMAVFIIVILSFFLPRTFQVVGERAGRIDNGIACALGDTRPECPRQVSSARVAETATFNWVQRAQYNAPPDKWSEEHPTPAGIFRLSPEKGERAEALYSNGVSDPLESSRQVDKRGEGVVGPRFRVRGIGKEVVVYLWVAER